MNIEELLTKNKLLEDQIQKLQDELIKTNAEHSANGKVYNVCGGEPLKMREYTNMLIEFSGLSNVEQIIDNTLWRPIDIQYQDGDSSLILNELGWKPEISIRDTIKDLLDFWYNKLK